MPAEPPTKRVPFNQIMGDALRDVDAAKLAESGVPPAPAPAGQTKPPKAPAPPDIESVVPPDSDFESADKEIVEGKRKPYADDFKRIKHAADEGWKKARELEPKVKEYEKELAELKKAPKHNAELIKTITDERDRYKGMFEQVAVEISPEFHAKYKTRLDTVKSSLPEEHADKLMALLQLPDSDAKRRHMSEITGEMDEFQVAEIVAANREVRVILNDRQGELNKSHEALGKIGEERTRKQQERDAAFGKTFENVIDKAQDAKAGIPAFQTREGDEAWNKGVTERLAVARAIYSGVSVSDADKAEAALWAASAPEFLNQLKSVTVELQAAKETIAKMTGATPPLDGHGPPGAEDRKLSFGELVTRDMRGQG